MAEPLKELFPACKMEEHIECVVESDLIRIDRKLVRCSCSCHEKK